MKDYDLRYMQRTGEQPETPTQPVQIPTRKKSIGERLRQYLRINAPEVDSNSLDELLRKLI